MRVDALGAAHRHEHVGHVVGGLAFTQEQIAAVLERGVEDAEQGLLQHGLEVDHDVAAADKVELAERRIGEQVVRRKHDHLADLVDDVVRVASDLEKAHQAIGRHVVGDAFGIDALAGDLDRLHVDVRREDLDLTADALLVHRLAEQDGDRIRLLPRRAAGDPHADGVALARSGQNVVDCLVLELLERILVAEEPRHADEDLAAERLGLAFVDLEQRGEVGQRRGVRDDHAPFDTAHHGGALVVREVDAADLLERTVDAQHRVVVVVKLDVVAGKQHRRMLREVEDLFDDLARRQHEVGKPGADGAAGHAVELGGGGVLHDDQAARLFDGLDAARAVRPRARQHHGNAAVAHLLGKRVEEDVDGMVDLAGVVFAEVQVALVDDHVVARGDEVDVVGQYLHLVARLDNGHLGLLAQDLGQHAAVVGRKVLDHDERAAANARHRVEELLEHLQPARACADADHQVLALFGIVAATRLARVRHGAVSDLGRVRLLANVVAHRHLAPFSQHGMRLPQKDARHRADGQGTRR